MLQDMEVDVEELGDIFAEEGVIAPVQVAQVEEEVNDDDGLICHELQRGLFREDGSLKIDINALDVEEVDKLMRTFRAGDDKSRLPYIRNLFTFVCCLAMDNLRKEDEASYFVLYPTLDSLFTAALISTPLDHFFAPKLGLTGPFPADFISYVAEKRDRPVTKNFLDKNTAVKQVPPELQKNHFFGQYIWNTAQDAKREINGRYNRHYVRKEDLKSGATPSGLMDAIRESLRIPEANKRAEKTLKARKTRLASQKKPLPADFDESEELQKLVIQQLDTTLTSAWFPDSWLAFTLLSLPAEERTINSFQTKSASVIQEAFITARQAEVNNNAANGHMSRNQKRTLNRVGLLGKSASTSASPASSSDTPIRPTALISHNVIHHDASVSKKRARMDNNAAQLKSTSESMQILLSLRKDNPEDTSFDDSIDKLRRKIVTLAQRVAAGGSDDDDDDAIDPHI